MKKKWLDAAVHSSAAILFAPQKETTSRGALPAVLVRQPVEGDGSLPARTLEETFDGVVPAQGVILTHAAIRWFKVGVVTLKGKKKKVTGTGKAQL